MSELFTLERESWATANGHFLTAALGRLRALLEAAAARRAGTVSAESGLVAAEAALVAAEGADSTAPTLSQLANAFGLSAFERDLLLLCAAPELDASFGALCAAAHDPQAPYPSFGLALAALPGAHWSAVGPEAPLRRWRLVELGPGQTLTGSPLRIAERVLLALFGEQQLDAQLAPVLEPVPPPVRLAETHADAARSVVARWARGADGVLPLVQLHGGEPADRRAVAAAACAALGLELFALPAHVLPLVPAELEALGQLWEREVTLRGAALLLEAAETEDRQRSHAVAWLAERLVGPTLLSGAERGSTRARPALAYELQPATPAEQRALWRSALGPAAARLNGQVDQLVAQFNLGAAAIGRVVDEVAGGDGPQAEALWERCRALARPRLDDLAQPIPALASWDDLVLPAEQRAVLRDICIHVRRRARVYEQWGFAGKSGRGLGISALFTGISGTGKTMAAEVLARELRLDLYRVDLSAVVSKYIGETEKNLARIFAAAEAGGAILLFDEADALFGKRSEVRDSHDRHANVEVAYLLQRIEAYRGLAILTTNMQDALDPAFMRRIRFMVQFPFPGAEQRAEIWRHTFPTATPTAGLAWERLATLQVAGGNIRSIALAAAFYAADEGAPLGMGHLLRAARAEYARLDRPLMADEIAGWE